MNVNPKAKKVDPMLAGHQSSSRRNEPIPKNLSRQEHQQFFYVRKVVNFTKDKQDDMQLFEDIAQHIDRYDKVFSDITKALWRDYLNNFEVKVANLENVSTLTT